MNFSSSELVPATRLILVLLVHFVWQATIVVGLVALVRSLIHPRHCQVRYLVLVAGLAALILLPFLTVAFDIGISEAVARRGPNPSSGVGLAVVMPEPVSLLQQVEARFQLVFAWFDQHRVFWLGGWIAGLTILMTRLSISLGYCWRLRRRYHPLPREIQELADGLTARINLKQNVVIGTSAEISQAIATGVWRPLILIPTAWVSQLPIESVEAVLAHELAHIKRWDLWVNFFQRFAETVFFFHPLVWWLSRTISNEREVCCDRLAVQITGQPIQYVETLNSVATKSESFDFQFGTAFSGGRNMNILRRAKLILEPGSMDTRSPLGGWVFVVAIGLLVSYGSFAYSAAGGPTPIQDRDQRDQRDQRDVRDRDRVVEQRNIRRDSDHGSRIVERERRRMDGNHRDELRNHLTELLHRNETETLSQQELVHRLRELANELEPDRHVRSVENVRRTETRTRRPEARFMERGLHDESDVEMERQERNSNSTDARARFERRTPGGRDGNSNRDSEKSFWRNTLTESRPSSAADVYFERATSDRKTDRRPRSDDSPSWRPGGSDREVGQLLRELKTEIQQLRREVNHLKAERSSADSVDVRDDFRPSIRSDENFRRRERDARNRDQHDRESWNFRSRDRRQEPDDELEVEDVRFHPGDDELRDRPSPGRSNPEPSDQADEPADSDSEIKVGWLQPLDSEVIVGWLKPQDSEEPGK